MDVLGNLLLFEQIRGCAHNMFLEFLVFGDLRRLYRLGLGAANRICCTQ